MTQWLQPSQYWTGSKHATRYICWTCANWYATAPELRTHIEADHPDIEITADPALAPSDTPR